MKTLFAALLVFGITLAQAINHQVTVGTGGFVYNPNTIQAAAGDTIEFIVNGMHSITEAPFSSPCTYLSGGAWSGFSPEPNFVITVTDIQPRFFYCSVTGHCQGGMVFALNPSSDMTFARFQSAAELTQNSITPQGGPVGGTSGPVPSGSDSSSSTTGRTSTSGAATSAAATTRTSSSSGLFVTTAMERVATLLGCVMLAAWYFM